MSSDEESTTKIPVLKRRKEYRIWVNRLSGHLKQKEVVYHLNFDVQMPILLLPQPEANPFIIPNTFYQIIWPHFQDAYHLELKN